MYAIIKTGGKQYRVEEGSILFIEKLDYEPEEEVIFDEVLALSKDSDLVVGKPLVEGASVSAKVIKNGRGKKIRIIKHKAKKGYMKRQGHRQAYTQVLIEKING